MLSQLDKMDNRAVTSAVFNVMRCLKPLHPQDTFYENYIGMFQRYQPFFDSYMLMWNIGATRPPRRVLEIGARTGTSFCQLLSAYMDTSVLEKAILIDPFLDGFSSAQIIFKNIQWLNLPSDKRVTVQVARSEDFIPTLQETFDYILVDGDHSKQAAMRDLEMVTPLCEIGGVIVFDDISTAPGECALIDVWEEWSSKHLDEFDFFVRLEGKGVAWAVRHPKVEAPKVEAPAQIPQLPPISFTEVVEEKAKKKVKRTKKTKELAGV